MDISTLLCSDGYFLYNKTLAKKLGPGEAIMIGLFCSKYNYYKQRDELINIDGKEYFFCVRSWIENETGLKEDKQRAIIQSLQVYKILDVKKVGMPAKNYYSLDFDALCKCFETSTTSNPQSPAQYSGNATTSGPEMPPQVIRKTDSSNNNTVISKDITPNNTKNNEDKVEETSTSHPHTETPTTLEDFRKSYITDKPEAKSSEVAEVIAYLNLVTGKNYRATTPETVKLITGRFKDGFTLDDMKKVIEHRWQLWKGTEMEQYMRPSTLFRPSKFEGYLNSLDTRRQTGKRGCSDTLAIHGVKHEKGFDELSKEEQTKSLTGRKF